MRSSGCNFFTAAALRSPAMRRMSSSAASLPSWCLGSSTVVKSGAKNAEPGIIVETYQTEILRAAQAHLFRGFQQPNGHQVIRDVDAVGTMGKQRVSGAESGFDSVIAFDDQFAFVG